MADIHDRAISYAALILVDDGVDITSEKLQTLIKAAGIEIEPVWANMYAKAFEGRNVGDLLMNVGAGGAAPAAGGGPAAAGGGGGGEEKAKEEEKPAEEEKEESDEDMGFGLFD